MKKIAALLLSMTLVLSSTTCVFAEENDTFTIGFCNYDNSDPFANRIGEEMKKYCDEKGWAVDITENLNDSETFMKCIDNYILKDVDVIASFWLDPAIAENAKAVCDEAGIPFIIMGCEPENQVVVSADNAEFGKMVGTKLAEAAVERWNGEVDSILAVETAQLGSLNEIRMGNAVQSMLDVLGKTEEDIEIVYVDTELDPVTAQQNVTSAYNAHPYWEKTLVICTNETHALAGVIPATIAEGKENEILTAEIQGYTEYMYYAIQDYDWVIGGGEHFGDAFVSVIGDLIAEVEAGNSLENGIYHVELTFLNKDNYTEYEYNK